MKNIFISILFLLLSFNCFANNNVDVRVKTVKDFLQNISSNKVILLDPGKYILYDSEYIENDYISMEGDGLVIQNVKNLTITSYNQYKTQILSDNGEGYVIKFENCENIHLENLKMGHSNAAVCYAPVLSFDSSKNVTLENLILFGSGMEGLEITSSKNFKCTGTIIQKCSSDIFSIMESKNISFDECAFETTGDEDNGDNLFNIYDNTSKLLLVNCLIKNNKTPTYNAMFNIDSSCTDIELKDSDIKNNKSVTFIHDYTLIKLENNDFSGNLFEDKY